MLFRQLSSCPYCKEIYFVIFAREDIGAFAPEHFVWVQLGCIGAREVTDFDGEVMSEKALRANSGIRNENPLAGCGSRVIGATLARVRETPRLTSAIGSATASPSRGDGL